MNQESKLRHLRELNRELEVVDPVFIAGYSDASWKPDPPDQGGGWGAWVRDNHTRVIASGPCSDWVEGPSDCELLAVCWAIRLALQHLNCNQTNIMVIKTDSQDVCRWFGWDGSVSVPREPEAQRLIAKAYELVAEKGIKLVVTWVKGHQGSGTTRGYLNQQVDRLARQARITQDRTLKKHRV